MSEPTLHPTIRTQHLNGVHTDCDRNSCQFWLDDKAEREHWDRITEGAGDAG